MTLTNRFVQKKTVPLWEADGEEQSLTVRGLSPTDISEILSQEEGALGELYLAFTNLAGDPLDLGTHLARLIDKMPALAARIIAQAADIPEEWEDVLDVPVGPQTELLDAITKLTFKSDESAKKAWEVVKAFARMAASKSPPSESRTGTGD